MINLIKSNCIAITCLIIYACITLTRIINHTPWFDEAHAWTIAEQLNFVDMFNYVKNEGHFFVWQALLYPFAHSHIIPYPYPMQALNWIFCLSALIVMWWKAPFNNWIKALITFSFPFLGCYGVIARCYSIGILLLFLLAALFDKKTKYPKTYAFLLILCANTSVMALIGATAFGILFLYEYIKSEDKKDKIWVYLILSAGAFLVLYQLFNIGYLEPISSNRKPHISVNIFRNSFINGQLIINCLLTCLFSVPFLRYFYENKKSLFFIGFVYSFLLIFLMAVYGGNFWHSYFFYIFLIIALWINKDADIVQIKKNALITFSVISLILVFHKPVNKDYYHVFERKSLGLLNIIENDDILNKAKITQNSGILYEIIPYSYGKTFKLKNHCHKEPNTDYDLLNNNDKICAIKNTIMQAKRYPDKLKPIIGNNTYTFIDKREYKIEKELEEIKANDYSIFFEKYKDFEHYSFWKIYVK